MAAYEAVGDLSEDGDAIADAMRAEADTIIFETTEDHGRLALSAFEALEALGFPEDRPLRILTHCNTGPLACGQYGTALGVVQAAHHAGRAVHVWVDETRPYLQGARLTAWELAQAERPAHARSRTWPPATSWRTARSTSMPRRGGPDRGQRRHREQGRDVHAGRAGGAPRHPVLRRGADQHRGPRDAGRRARSRSRSARRTRCCSSAAWRIAPPDTDVRNPAFDVTPAGLDHRHRHRGGRDPGPVRRRSRGGGRATRAATRRRRPGFGTWRAARPRPRRPSRRGEPAAAPEPADDRPRRSRPDGQRRDRPALGRHRPPDHRPRRCSTRSSAQDRLYAAYAICDLEEREFGRTRWGAAYDGDELVAVGMEYTGPDAAAAVRASAGRMASARSCAT